jgi:hypothetical protein
MFDRSLIETYAAGGAKLREAVEGLTGAQLKAFPVPGTWSIQQIIVHLNDADAVGIDRMKRVVAMDRPLLIGYDESAFAARLRYDQQLVPETLDVFDTSRRLWAITLRSQPDEAFERFGIHNERGKVSLEDLVKDYIRHLDHHLGFVHRKRQMLLV